MAPPLKIGLLLRALKPAARTLSRMGMKRRPTPAEDLLDVGIEETEFAMLLRVLEETDPQGPVRSGQMISDIDHLYARLLGYDQPLGLGKPRE